MTDDHNLERFVEAQAPVFSQVVDELMAGRKTSHWMWFVFPQIEGLGSSPMAQRFAIRSLDEARAYLDHPVLGPRLRQCADLVLQIPDRSVHDVFGSPDDMKFRSSMTLFREASPDEPVFEAALRKYFDGRPCEKTLQRI